jgi:uncharacterized SAM-binding protein YcdF (DUF218 family)
MSAAPIKRSFWAALARYGLFVMGLIIAGLAIGFIVFAVTISRLDVPEEISDADGIVVWTGKGGDRLQAGVQLLADKKGERLLISGTNENLSRETILAALDLPASLAACCVDMDQATDTIDNARQTANWARALSYDHIILVTSAYHMPRAEIEIGNAAGRVGITSYPVREDNAPPWWRDLSQIKRMGQEYGKLILSFIRNNHKRGTPPISSNAPPAQSKTAA